MCVHVSLMLEPGLGQLAHLEETILGKRGFLFLIKQVKKGSEESEKRRHPEMISWEKQTEIS